MLIYFKTVKEIKLRKPTTNPLLTPKGIKRLVSPYNITPKSKIVVMRIKDIIASRKRLLIFKQILLINSLGNV